MKGILGHESCRPTYVRAVLLTFETIYYVTDTPSEGAQLSGSHAHLLSLEARLANSSGETSEDAGGALRINERSLFWKLLARDSERQLRRRLLHQIFLAALPLPVPTCIPSTSCILLCFSGGMRGSTLDPSLISISRASLALTVPSSA